MDEDVGSGKQFAPPLFTSTSTLRVRELESIALELRVTVPVKVWPGYSSRVSVAVSPLWMSGA